MQAEAVRRLDGVLNGRLRVQMRVRRIPRARESGRAGAEGGVQVAARAKEAEEVEDEGQRERGQSVKPGTFREDSHSREHSFPAALVRSHPLHPLGYRRALHAQLERNAM
jgi:hypothetical protein